MQCDDRRKPRAASYDHRRVVIRIAGFLCFLALLITAPFAVADGGAPAKKPQVPIRLQFGTEGPVAVGSAVTVTLTVTPMISSESVAVVAVLPEGLHLVNGETVWTGALAKGESHTLTMTVRPEQVNLSIPQMEIKGKATLTLPNGAQISRLAVLTLEPDSSKSKLRMQERRSPGGDSILEIPAPSGPNSK
jgi:hypothetical protein